VIHAYGSAHKDKHVLQEAARLAMFKCPGGNSSRVSSVIVFAGSNVLVLHFMNSLTVFPDPHSEGPTKDEKVGGAFGLMARGFVSRRIITYQEIYILNDIWKWFQERHLSHKKPFRRRSMPNTIPNVQAESEKIRCRIQYL